MVEALPKVTISDYEQGKVIGEGAFGKVMLCRHKQTGELYAIKSVSKSQIQKLGKTRHIFREKDLLTELKNQHFIITLISTTMDEDNLYFIFENCENGDLAELISKRKKLSVELTRFYTAQLVQAIELLQSKEIMHRDLKPQNILLDANMNIKLIDFGEAKKEGEEPIEDEQPTQTTMAENGVEDFEPDFAGDKPENNARRGTFVGTANFLAPEMIKDSESSCATDLWALGCIIFKMLVGRVCFPGNAEMSVFPLILSRDIDWPDEKQFKFDRAAKDLIDRLLQVHPEERLGCPGTGHDIQELKKHPFFKGIDFSQDLSQQQDVKKALLDMEVQDMLDQGLDPNAEMPLEVRMSFAIQSGKPILEGTLVKKNKWRMKQDRKFFLYADGRITYFKDLEQKGVMVLTKDASARKISRYELEVTLPATQRVYTLLQGDISKLPVKKEGFSCMLDDWVDAINSVLEFMRSQ